MEAPIVGEFVVADDRAQLQDGLCASEAPAGAGDVHAVLDEVTAGALNYAGCDGPSTL
jgi:hypothetical protein